MSKSEMIDEVYRRLAQAPVGLDCDNGQVLCALGLLANAILTVSSSDPADRQERTNRFCRALMACVNPSHNAIARRH